MKRYYFLNGSDQVMSVLYIVRQLLSFLLNHTESRILIDNEGFGMSSLVLALKKAPSFAYA